MGIMPTRLIQHQAIHSPAQIRSKSQILRLEYFQLMQQYRAQIIQRLLERRKTAMPRCSRYLDMASREQMEQTDQIFNSAVRQAPRIRSLEAVMLRDCQQILRQTQDPPIRQAPEAFLTLSPMVRAQIII